MLSRGMGIWAEFINITEYIRLVDDVSVCAEQRTHTHSSCPTRSNLYLHICSTTWIVVCGWVCVSAIILPDNSPLIKKLAMVLFGLCLSRLPIFQRALPAIGAFERWVGGW